MCSIVEAPDSSPGMTLSVGNVGCQNSCWLCLFLLKRYLLFQEQPDPFREKSLKISVAWFIFYLSINMFLQLNYPRVSTWTFNLLLCMCACLSVCSCLHKRSFVHMCVGVCTCMCVPISIWGKRKQEDKLGYCQPPSTPLFKDKVFYWSGACQIH